MNTTNFPQRHLNEFQKNSIAAAVKNLPRDMRPPILSRYQKKHVLYTNLSEKDVATILKFLDIIEDVFYKAIVRMANDLVCAVQVDQPVPNENDMPTIHKNDDMPSIIPPPIAARSHSYFSATQPYLYGYMSINGHKYRTLIPV